MITPINLAIFGLICGGLMKFCWQIGLENMVDIPSFLMIDARIFFLAKAFLAKTLATGIS